MTHPSIQVQPVNTKRTSRTFTLASMRGMCAYRTRLRGMIHRPGGKRMTADQYRAALKSLGLSQIGAARMMGVSRRTGQAYASNGPSGPAAFGVRVLLALPEEQRAGVIERARRDDHED